MKWLGRENRQARAGRSLALLLSVAGLVMLLSACAAELELRAKAGLGKPPAADVPQAVEPKPAQSGT